MSRRTRLYNAFEGQLAVDMTIGAASCELIDATGLAAPGRVVIDFRDPLKREWIEFAGVAGNTLTGLTRGLIGSSAAGGAIEHASGAMVRSVPMHQHFDDIFSDIEDLEAGLEGHSEADDPHPQYSTDTELAETDAIVTTHTADIAAIDTRIDALEVVSSLPIPVGTIIMYAGTAPEPAKWMFCDGRELAVVDYPDLSAVIGLIYTPVDPEPDMTVFNLPDLRVKFPLGKGLVVGSQLGATGGDFNHTHTGGSHQHGIPPGGGHNHDIAGASVGVTSSEGNRLYLHTASGERHTHDLDADGGHDHTGSTNMGGGSAVTTAENPPYLALNFLIKVLLG